MAYRKKRLQRFLRVAGTWGCPGLFLDAAHQSDHDSLLCVQAVLRFLEDLACVLLEHLGGDLLLAVCRQAVLHHAARLRGGETLYQTLFREKEWYL